MANDEFEFWLGHAAKERLFGHQVGRALKLAGGRLPSGGNRAARFDGSRIGRGSGVGRTLSEFSRYSGARSRRVVVKVRIVRMAGNGARAAATHLRYMQRDGTTREGERGKLYSADLDSADGKAFLARSSGDRHQFRIIVSAEDGGEYENLRPVIRRLLAQGERDLATRLDWVAADHFNTGHPHSHIMVRGKDDQGDNLIIAREYITDGLRGRATDIVNLDLGPRTNLEVMRANLREMTQRRFTEIDRRLQQSIDAEGLVSPHHRDGVEQSLRAGRLATLSRMGLTVEEHPGRWRLPEDLEPTLRAMGKRSEMIETIDREVRARGLATLPVDYVIYNPAGRQSKPIVGQIAARGLSDEESGHEYLILEGIDGRAYYVEIGSDGVEHGHEGAIVRIAPTPVGVREVDRTVAEIGAANALRFERQRTSREPVRIERLAAIPLAEMPCHDGITWLDDDPSLSQLVAHGHGFASTVVHAMQQRRQWLLEQGLADKPDRLDILRKRELKRLAGQLSRELGAEYIEAEPGFPIAGTYRRSIQVGTARMALIENAREFTLVPWRPELEHRIGREISGIMRDDDVSWTFGRQRSGPEI